MAAKGAAAWRSLRPSTGRQRPIVPSSSRRIIARSMKATLGVNREAVVRSVETLRVVAVIRLRDAGKLRAVVDALAAGGVRAVEVTMTVPNAVSLIRELAPSLPAGFVLGA